MSIKKSPGEKIGNVAPFGLRMLPDLKARIEDAAAESGRSLNAEIVARLEQSFDPLVVNVRSTGDIYAELDKIVQRTIRTVREEERRTGVPPLPHELPVLMPGATIQPDALIKNPDGTYTVVEVKRAGGGGGPRKGEMHISLDTDTEKDKR